MPEIFLNAVCLCLVNLFLWMSWFIAGVLLWFMSLVIKMVLLYWRMLLIEKNPLMIFFDIILLERISCINV